MPGVRGVPHWTVDGRASGSAVVLRYFCGSGVRWVEDVRGEDGL
jgi:hypothetical protein